MRPGESENARSRTRVCYVNGAGAFEGKLRRGGPAGKGDDDGDDDHDDSDDDDADDDDDHLRVACYLGAPMSHVTPGRACHMLPRGARVTWYPGANTARQSQSTQIK